MSKKQIRISGADEVRKRLPNLTRRSVNLVLRNNTVVFGILDEVRDDHVVVSNMRKKKMRVAFDTIVEAYTDVDP
ncbi:MAG: hypothetical protein DIU61_001750 [Bacteroidota bacterium]|nr:MAG: hypothetical protein DIU61_03010 [Bacteroidota bacterium]